MSPKKQSNQQNNSSKVGDQEELLEEIFEQPQNNIPRTRVGRVLVIGLVISVVVGLATGFIGVGLVLSGSFSDVPPFNMFSLETILPERQVIVRQQQAVTVTHDQQVQDIVVKRKSSLATFVSLLPESEDLAVYTNKDVLGFGFVLSSDGWIVGLDEVLADQKVDEVGVLINDRLYTIDSYEADPVSEMLFVKVPAEHLLVAPLNKQFDFVSGDNLILLTLSHPSGQVIVDEMTALRYSETPLVVSSESLGRDVVLDQVTGKTLSAPVFDFSGEVVGVMRSDSSLMRPVTYVVPYIDSVLAGKSISRPVIGIDWINLHGNVGLPDEVRKAYSKGAYVHSVDPKGVLNEQGIVEGDIIKSVQTIELNGGPNFSELIQQILPGEPVVMTVVHEGEEREINFVMPESSE